MDARSLARVAPAVLAVLAFGACGGEASLPAVATLSPVTSPATMTLSGPFAEGALIPADYTCDGEDRHPAFQWSAPPASAVELVLVMQDPDAPAGVFTHWVVAGLLPGERGLSPGPLPEGARQALNAFGTKDYAGPCPPPGDPHRYVFTLYALGKRAPQTEAAAELIDYARTYAVAYGDLTGTYARS